MLVNIHDIVTPSLTSQWKIRKQEEQKDGRGTNRNQNNDGQEEVG